MVYQYRLNIHIGASSLHKKDLFTLINLSNPVHAGDIISLDAEELEVQVQSVRHSPRGSQLYAQIDILFEEPEDMEKDFKREVKRYETGLKALSK